MYSNCSTWVQRYLSQIPRDAGPVLDLACGEGRHARLMQQAGFEVLALDKNPQAFAQLRSEGIACLEFDLEHLTSPCYAHSSCDDPFPFSWPFEPAQLAGIVVCNYLHRPLMPWILNSLNDGGCLIYETFARGHEQYGRPRNPQFLLEENELLRHFVWPEREGWRQRCLAYEMVLEQRFNALVNQAQTALVQRICVRVFRDK